VTTLASGDQKPGYYNLTWNRQDAKGRTCACGVYFCTLSAENKRFSRKVVPDRVEQESGQGRK